MKIFNRLADQFSKVKPLPKGTHHMQAMLEDEKPLVQPQPRQITAPKTTKKKAKTRVKGKSKKARKSAKKGKKKTTVKKKKHHKSSKVAKKKSRKSHKKKSPATAPKRQSGPQEG